MPAARGILRSEQNAVNPPPEVLLAQILGSFGHKFGWVFHKFTENGELYIKWFHSLRGKNRDAYPHRPVQWSMYIPSMSTIVCPLLAAWPSNCRVLDQDTSGANDEENLPWTNVPSTHPTRFETGEPFRSVASAYFSNLWKRHRCALNILVEYQYRPHVQPWSKVLTVWPQLWNNQTLIPR